MAARCNSLAAMLAHHMTFVTNMVRFMITYGVIFPNGKKYIGITTRTLKQRISDHKQAMTRVDNKLYRALTKYGIDNVEFREISHHDNIDELRLAEEILINRHKTQTKGYNTTAGGGGVKKLEYTDEIRQNMSVGQKQRFSREEEREKTSNGMKTWIKEHPIEHQKNMEKRIQTLQTDEYRKQASEKQSQYLLNNPDATAIQGKKISENYKKNPDILRQISKSLGGSEIEVYKDGVKVAEYPTLSECGRAINRNISNIASVIKGKRNNVAGFQFKRKS